MPLRFFVAAVTLSASVVVLLMLTSKGMDEPTAIAKMKQIQQGMLFAEISDLIPLSENCRLSVREHGGIFYDVPISSKYLIQLRFEHMPSGRDPKEARINFSPRLRNRSSLSFVAGDEEAW